MNRQGSRKWWVGLVGRGWRWWLDGCHAKVWWVGSFPGIFMLTVGTRAILDDCYRSLTL